MTEDKILRTAQYAEGDLSDSERLAFEKLLTQDAELKQHLNDYREIHSSLKMEFAVDEEREALVKTLHQLNKQHFKAVKANPKLVNLNNYLKWVGSVAAILIVGLFIWAPWQGNLYEQYHSASEMSVTERGADKTYLDEAAALFNEKKYADAKVLLAKLNAADPENTMVSYYYGVSLLETSEVVKSRALLISLYNGESVFRYDAAYTIAMSYLKENNKEDAKLWLLKIPEGTAQFSKAQALLKKL